MATFQQAKYIELAVESCLQQTLSSIEIVLIDDGSQDGSIDKLKRFSDPRLHIMRQKNAGPSMAFNLGIKQARAPYIALMSGDDVCVPDRLELQLNEICSKGFDVIFGRPSLIDEVGSPLPESSAPVFFCDGPASSSEMLRELFFKGNFLCGPASMVRASVFADCAPFHPALYQLQDFELWLRLCRRHQVGLSENTVINYRIRDKGANLSSRSNHRRIQMELDWVYKQFLESVDPDTLWMAFSRDIKLWGLEESRHEDWRILLALLHAEPFVNKFAFDRLIDRFGEEPAIAFGGLAIEPPDLARILLNGA